MTRMTLAEWSMCPVKHGYIITISCTQKKNNRSDTILEVNKRLLIKDKMKNQALAFDASLSTKISILTKADKYSLNTIST